MKFKNESVILYVLIAVGLIAALFGVKSRLSVESHNKRTEITIDYSDALNLALAARKPLDSVLTQLRESGVTTLALWEDPLDDLRVEGAMSINAIDPSHTTLTFSPNFPGEEERVVDALRHKTVVGFRRDGDTLTVSAPYNQISGLGVGLEPSEIATALKDGFLISPRLYNYSGATPAAIQWMIDRVKAQCRGRANVVIFNGPDVLGDRGDIDAAANALRSDGLLYGSLELGKQIGDDTLSRDGADLTVRVHSIGGNEMPTMDEPTAVARFALAARERNIRSCYVRLFQNSLVHQPDILAANIGYIKDIVNALHDGGIRIGAAHAFSPDPRPKRVLLLLMGFGVAASVVLLLRQYFPLTGNWFWLFLIGGLLVGGFLATRESTMIGRQIVALAAACTFPTLGLIFGRPPRDARFTRHTFRALELSFRQLEIMTVITLCGIIFVVGVLADRLMIIKVYEFLGIRLVIIAPLILMLIHEGLGFSALRPSANWNARKEAAAERWRAFTSSPVLIGQVIFGLVVLAVVGIIVLRSGNDPGVGVSSSELSFRALLNRVLYVRPRTKEILFGYPLLVTGLALYFTGNRRWYILFACAGAIAIADLQDTFCHLHTPIEISVIRALLGWIIGTVFGIVLFLIVRRYDRGGDLKKNEDEPPMYSGIAPDLAGNLPSR